MDRETLRSLSASRRNHAEEEAPVTKKVKWTCEFCAHDFVHERVFMKHVCKERLRIEELRGPIGQAAYIYYTDWMRLNKRSVPPIETFASSSYYLAFVKFANHVKRVNMPNPTGFVRAMVENGNIQPSLWCRDNVYAMYLQGYDKVVSPTKQFLDSMDLVYEYSKEFEVEPQQVFAEIGVTKILDLVQKRKLSPWFLVSSGAFRRFMSNCNELDADLLERGVQVGAMIMRIQQSKENTKLFMEFSQATKELNL
ncbi:hypothetical protein [Acinetobacter sp.]|uniref:hypothetical protein n=1 Tax=Acinetobacter sp. TaxID=472 RepID=UPI00388FF993